jgi:hypothetical protein
MHHFLTQDVLAFAERELFFRQFLETTFLCTPGCEMVGQIDEE